MMKKYIIPLCVAAFATVACTMEEQDCPVGTEATSPLTLTGYSCVDTRVSIGDKDGETYPLLWSTGDAININSTDGTTWVDEMALLYSGSQSGVSGIFQTVGDLYPETDMDLLILYPGYTMAYDGKTISGSVASTQTQDFADSSSHVGDYCFAFAETSIEAGQTEGATFTLGQKTAFVKVIVKKLEDFSDYRLSGVTLKAEGYALAGDVSYKLGDETLTVENASETVGATISNPTRIDDEQAVYFTALPCDLTGEKVLLTILMTGDKGTETISIPLYIDGGELAESCLSIIEVNGIDDLLPWYDPFETRDLMGGWAYGPQNTYFIEQPTTENGHISIDVRARGDFSMVKEPKYYALLVGSSEYNEAPDDAMTKLCYLSNSTYDYINWVEENPSSEVNDDYTIDVYCYGSDTVTGGGRWSLIGLFDEDYNVLWSFMVWKYLAGDEPKDVDYGGGNYLLDRIIGAEYSNSMAEEKGTFNFPAVALFQWGRKDPVSYLCNSSYKTWYFRMAERTDETTIEYSIAHPTLSFTPGNYDWDWIGKSNTNELWGGPQASLTGINTVDVGHKTIYDPCPEGYRVCDGNILEEVRNNAEPWEVPYTASYQDKSNLNPDSPFFKKGEKGEDEGYSDATGESVLAYRLAPNVYDYWPYAGFHYNTTSAGFNSTADLSCIYWSANVKDENTAFGIQRIYWSGDFLGESNYQARQRGCAIRCQKE